MQYYEDNYISVVLLCQNSEKNIVSTVNAVWDVLESNFKHFEIIVVDNASTDHSRAQLQTIKHMLNIVELAYPHTIQAALTAGINYTVGDYIFEVPNMDVEFSAELIMSLYRQSQNGFDFVFAKPKKIGVATKCFYYLLNKQFRHSREVPVVSSVITLSSRRGQNKTLEIGQKIINRNVAYYLTGLNALVLDVDVQYRNSRYLFESTMLMIDTFIYYTDYITKFSSAVSLLFLLLSLLGVFYGVFSYFTKETVSGWMSTFVFSGTAFAGVFLMFGVISRYMSHVLRNTSNAKQFIYRSAGKKEGVEEDDHSK